MKTVSILYVEDNELLRDSIAELLSGSDRLVTSVADGEQALTAFTEQPFDIVVTDVSLPEMSGTELARRILATHPQQWIIFCSGYELQHGLSALGPNVCSLPKPFELEELDALMDDITNSLQR